MLCSVSQHSKVQVPCWMPFCYLIINKRRNVSFISVKFELLLFSIRRLTIMKRRQTNYFKNSSKSEGKERKGEREREGGKEGQREGGREGEREEGREGGRRRLNLDGLQFMYMKYMYQFWVIMFTAVHPKFIPHSHKGGSCQMWQENTHSWMVATAQRIK